MDRDYADTKPPMLYSATLRLRARHVFLFRNKEKTFLAQSYGGAEKKEDVRWIAVRAGTTRKARE